MISNKSRRFHGKYVQTVCQDLFFVLKMLFIFNILMTYHEVRFKSETWVMSSRLHIFAMKHLCFYGTHTGTLAESIILRGQRAVYIYLQGNIAVLQWPYTATVRECHCLPVGKLRLYFAWRCRFSFHESILKSTIGSWEDLERISYRLHIDFIWTF